jgi:hypothetical protein
MLHHDIHRIVNYVGAGMVVLVVAWAALRSG